MKHFSKFFSGKHFPVTEKKNLQQASSSYSTTVSNLDKEISKINSFIRSGLTVLSVILISGIAIAYGQKNISEKYNSTSGSLISNKKLPIYCVDQKEKKVALSFDAAWGESFLM